jgi:L-2-hydroxyglutarate oxidase
MVLQRRERESVSTYDVTIVGGGIIGLSVGWAIMRRHPKVRLLVLEKERQWGHHQTGHNSGEIHSGIYYRPGSLKANFCRDGNHAMVKFCREYGVPHEICGKVIVATAQNELPLLEGLYQRSRLNGVTAMRLCPEEIREIEPYCTGLAGLRVPSAGIVDYRRVA